MQMNILKREHPNKKSRQVGRGGTRGKTSGRGGKGQTARAGNKRRPELRDIIKKIPKLRGYRFASFQKKPCVVNVESLNLFDNGSIVNLESLLSKNLVKKIGGVFPKVKILGKGDLTKKLSVSECQVSSSARSKIEKAGGEIK